MSKISEAMTRSRRGKELLPSISSQPVLTSVVDSTEGERSKRIVQRLLTIPESRRPTVILVVSAVHGEGASTVARDVAHALATNGSDRVLLVDANLRTPSQHIAFGIELTEGLSDVLAGAIELDDAIHRNLSPKLSLLTCGRPARNIGLLLDSSGLGSVMERLRNEFPWIIIDSPPITVHPDSETLALSSDAAIMVLRAERTRCEVGGEAKRLLERAGVPIFGGVLNRRRHHIPQFIYRML